MTAASTMTPALPVLPDQLVEELVEELKCRGATMLVGSIVDMAGVARAKAVPIGRAGIFHRTGVGAAPTWNVFCIDNEIEFTNRLGVVGDLRLRADLAAARLIGARYAWAPVAMFDQDGYPWPGCARGRLSRIQADAAAVGVHAQIGHEIEFVILDAQESSPVSNQWQAYGLGAVLRRGGFIADLEEVLASAGLSVEQMHAEYAMNQFEISLAPRDPVGAADDVVLARHLICHVARSHGMLASFSPLSFAGGAGNGAHQHMSLFRRDVPLFSGGSGPHGLTDEGSSAVAGIVRGLPECIGVFAGSVLSSLRLRPGLWSGAYACWGRENREAAVRLCGAAPVRNGGANIELKCIDPSANPYLSSAMLLGLALNGIADGMTLPPEVAGNPALAAANGAVPQLADNQPDAIAALQNSDLAEQILGADIVSALVAVRAHEADRYGSLPEAELIERFRFAWSS